MRGLRATASAALLAWGLTWSAGGLHAAPTVHVEPRRPTPVTGKVSVDAPAAVTPPAVSTAVQVPAPAHLPAAPYDLQAPTHAPGAVVGAGAAVTPMAKPATPTAQPKRASDQSVAKARDVSRETSPKLSAKTMRSSGRSAKLAQQGGATMVDAAVHQGRKPGVVKSDRASARVAKGQMGHTELTPQQMTRRPTAHAEAGKAVGGASSAKLARGAQKASPVSKHMATPGEDRAVLSKALARKEKSGVATKSLAHGASHGGGKGARAGAKAVAAVEAAKVAKAPKKSGAAPKAMASAATTKPAQAVASAKSAKLQTSRAQVYGPASKVRASRTEAVTRGRTSGKATDLAKAGAGARVGERRAAPGTAGASSAAHHRPHPHGA